MQIYDWDDILTDEDYEAMLGRPFGLGTRARDGDGFEVYEDARRHWTILTGEKEAARWVEVQVQRRVDQYFSRLEGDVLDPLRSPSAAQPPPTELDEPE